MKWSQITHVGRVRSVNEDYYCVRPDLNFFAVTDGMGGHKAGDVASREAIKHIEAAVERAPCHQADPGSTLYSGVLAANQAIYELSYYNQEYSGMGTTITACCFNGLELTIGHVGDSRCYLIREGSISRLTEDHSLVGELVRQNQITPGEAIHHPQRNVLTRSLGTSSRVEVDILRYQLKPGDIILLCTDGLTEHITDEEILKNVQGREPEEAVDVLAGEAISRGGSDNITAVMVVYELI